MADALLNTSTDPNPSDRLCDRLGFEFWLPGFPKEEVPFDVLGLCTNLVTPMAYHR